MGRRIRLCGVRDENGKLVGVRFSKGQGAFTMNVRDEQESDTDAGGERQRERPRLSFAEWAAHDDARSKC